MFPSKVLIKIAKRLILVSIAMVLIFPLSMLWYLVLAKRGPWIDTMLNWAIDAPMTAYEQESQLKK